MKLLFRMAEWHSFAKLRMHTTSTIDHLEELTKDFGRLMRQFRDLTCSKFETVELLHEVRARKWQRKRSKTKASQPEKVPAASSASASRKVKTLNITTSKFHSLRDYVQTIQMFGCTDSFSTQLVWQCSSLCTQVDC